MPAMGKPAPSRARYKITPQFSEAALLPPTLSEIRGPGGHRPTTRETKFERGPAKSQGAQYSNPGHRASAAALAAMACDVEGKRPDVAQICVGSNLQPTITRSKPTRKLRSQRGPTHFTSSEVKEPAHPSLPPELIEGAISQISELLVQRIGGSNTSDLASLLSQTSAGQGFGPAGEEDNMGSEISNLDATNPDPTQQYPPPHLQMGRIDQQSLNAADVNLASQGWMTNAQKFNIL